jgi:hypothetical protein
MPNGSAVLVDIDVAAPAQLAEILDADGVFLDHGVKVAKNQG